MRDSSDPNHSTLIKILLKLVLSEQANKAPISQTWNLRPVIPALGRSRQEDCKVEVILDFIARPRHKHAAPI